MIFAGEMQAVVEAAGDREQFQVSFAHRADGIRAAVFRQERDGTGGWADAQVEPRREFIERYALDVRNLDI